MQWLWFIRFILLNWIRTCLYRFYVIYCLEVTIMLFPCGLNSSYDHCSRKYSWNLMAIKIWYLFLICFYFRNLDPILFKNTPWSTCIFLFQRFKSMVSVATLTTKLFRFSLFGNHFGQQQQRRWCFNLAHSLFNPLSKLRHCFPHLNKLKQIELVNRFWEVGFFTSRLDRLIEHLSSLHLCLQPLENGIEFSTEPFNFSLSLRLSTKLSWNRNSRSQVQT